MEDVVSFSRRTGAAVLSLMIVVSVFAASVHPAHAAPGDGATSNILLLDSNENGYPDRITFEIANPNGETWSLEGASPHGLSVTQSGDAISIDAVAITSAADANPVVIQIDLDEDDVDLAQNTDGVNDEPIELIYTQQTGDETCTVCIRDAVDEEMNTIATGDTGPTDTEVDAMEPVVISARTTKSHTSGASFDTMTLMYTERIFVSLDGDGGVDLSRAGTGIGQSNATVGAMTTARTIAGIGSWAELNGGDRTVSSATGNWVLLHGGENGLSIVMNYYAHSYYNAGTTAPTTAVFTPVSDADIVFDAAGNAVLNQALAMSAPSAWDVTPPTISDTYSCDTNSDGNIDRVQITFSEDVYDASIAASVFEVDNDDTNNGVGEEVPASFNTATGGCDGNANDATINDNKIRLDLTTGIPGTEAAYVHYASAVGSFVRDEAGNRLADGSALGTENDNAPPLLLSVTPTHGSIGVDAATDVVLTFSEAINTGTDDISLSGGVATTDVWSNGNRTYTIEPDANLSNGLYTVSVDVAADVAGNAFGGGSSGVSSPSTFRIGFAPSSSGPSVAKTYSVLVNSPNGGETIASGATHTVTWSTGGTGNIAVVNIYYSLDGGATFTQIASNEPNDGSFMWMVPNVGGTQARVKVVGTDLVTELAHDVSDANFTIGSATNDDSGGETSELEDEDDEDPLAGIEVGDFVRGQSQSAVYFIDVNANGDLVRRPFMDAQTYFTWEDSFDAVGFIDDGLFALLPMGAPVVPKAGVVLIKIQSIPKVYMIEGANTIRWIETEEIAIELFGEDWADYVIDVQPTMFPHLVEGDSVGDADDVEVDRLKMKKRDQLNA